MLGEAAILGGGDDETAVGSHTDASISSQMVSAENMVRGEEGDDAARATGDEAEDEDDCLEDEADVATKADNSDTASNAGLAPRPYSCLQCDRHYTRAEHLRRHQTQRHTTTRRFTCQQCGRSFVRSDVFKKHVALHARSPAAGSNIAAAGSRPGSPLRGHSLSSGQEHLYRRRSESSGTESMFLNIPGAAALSEVAAGNKRRRSIASTEPNMPQLPMMRNVAFDAAADDAPTMAQSRSSGMPSLLAYQQFDYRAPHSDALPEGRQAHSQFLRPPPAMPQPELQGVRSVHYPQDRSQTTKSMKLSLAAQTPVAARNAVKSKGACVRCVAAKIRCSDYRPCENCEKRGVDCVERLYSPSDPSFPSNSAYSNIGHPVSTSRASDGRQLVPAVTTRTSPAVSDHRLPPLKPYISARMTDSTNYSPALPPMMPRTFETPVANPRNTVMRQDQRLAPLNEVITGPSHSSPFPQRRAHPVHYVRPPPSAGAPSAPAGSAIKLQTADSTVSAGRYRDVPANLPRLEALPARQHAVPNGKHAATVSIDAEGAENLLHLHSPPLVSPLRVDVKPTAAQGVDAVPSTFIKTDPGPNVQVVPLQSLIAGRHWTIDQLETALRNCHKNIEVVASYRCNKDAAYYLPDAPTLRSFLASYFEFFHKYIPFLHAATFDPCKVHWLLLLTVASVGARYLDQCKRAVALLTACKAGLRTITMDSDLDDPDSPEIIQVFSAYLLMRVSSPNVLPSSMQLNLPAGYIVRYFKSAFTKVQVTAEDWEAWICVQNKKRLALAYLYFDSLQSVLTESPSSLPIIDALDAELPDSAALWCAGSAQEWLQAYVVPGRLRTRSLFETFAAYVNPDEAAYVHHLVKTDTAIARFTFLLARMLHGQAHALQGVVAELWRDIRGRQVTRPLDHFSGSTERLHKLLFHHGERNWNMPSAKPCFTVTPMLLAIATSIRLSALRGFARETVPAATAARTAVSQWMRADDGKVAKKNLSRAVQVFTTVINLKDHESMSHYARGPSIFYSACVIHAYGDFARVHLNMSPGDFKHLEADEAAGEPLFLDEQPDDDHPDLRAWLDNTRAFRPYISPACTGNALSLFRDTSIILHHAVAEISRGRAWAEANAEFAEDLLKLVRTTAMLWGEQDGV